MPAVRPVQAAVTGTVWASVTGWLAGVAVRLPAAAEPSSKSTSGTDSDVTPVPSANSST